MDKRQNVILIIDDTPENLRVLGELLEADKVDVRVATNGSSGLQIARGSAVDLILLDIMMPEVDGYEVCRQLKSDKSTSDIPVIFLTALDAPEDEAKGLKLGAVDYISKPFKLELVRARVANHLALRNAHQELQRFNERLEGLVAERTQQLAEAHRRLQTLDSAKYDFLQMIYQRLWAPDSGIVDLSRKALEALDNTPAKRRELLLQYELSQSQLFETINNALLMAGSNTGEKPDSSHPVILEKVLADSLGKLKPLSSTKGLAFKQRLPQPGIIAGDLDLLYQALTTTLHVAILLARRDSTISIIGESHDRATNLGISVKVDRIDPAENITSLFDVANGFHASGIGRELGLAIPLASKIIISLGGNITVTKESAKEVVIRIALCTFTKTKGVHIALP